VQIRLTKFTLPPADSPFASSPPRARPGASAAIRGRVAIALPGRDGTALLPGLPPGEYFVAALDGRVELSEAERLDIGTLMERLTAGAARVTLTEGEKQSVSVRIVER